MTGSRARSWGLAGLAGASFGALAVLAWVPIDGGPWVWATAGGAALSGVLVTLAAFRETGRFAAGRFLWSARIGIAVVAVAALARVALLPDTRWLSDDAARYHWDGKLVARGENPYRYAPSDAALAPQRNAEDAWITDRINHPDVRTVYPPLAELAFALAWWLTPGSLLGFRLLVLLAEGVACALLARRLRRDGRAPAPLLLVLWSPLLLVEGYLPGHSDLLGLPFLVGFLLAVRAGRPLAAGSTLALACLVKPLPLLLVPAAARALGVRRSALAAAAFGVVVVAAYLPFVGGEGADPFGSMGLMASAWRANGTVAALLDWLLPAEAARWAAAGLLGAAVLAAAGRRASFEARALLALAAFAALTPVVFPWYLVWALPLLVLHPSPAVAALVALLPLTEGVMAGWFADGVWAPPTWTTAVAFAPFYALAAWEAWRGVGLFARPGAQTPIHSRSSRTRASTT